MTRAAEILKAQRAAERVSHQAERAARLAYARTREAGWAIACDPGHGPVNLALRRAILAQNAAIEALAKQRAARQAIADAWRH
ncbi:hypothetical protein [Agrobacterium larrymoorei]|uniref:hypothetical protein n=1 Tax=Agrobacterium larrymoorei TaxID=160699 RepID=UPI0030BABDA5